MFVVTEAEAAEIRVVYQQRGELSAAVELRRRFPGITDNAQAREWPGPSPAGSRRRCSGCLSLSRRGYVGCADVGSATEGDYGGTR
jgi:hypothetical protein